MTELTLRFDGGTLLLDGPPELRSAVLAAVDGFTYDPRVDRPRAPAHLYRRLVAELRHHQLDFQDEARRYQQLPLCHRLQRQPYPHQREAVAAWNAGHRRGIVVLPTGSGKTYVAEMALSATQRSALVIAPTIDLMNQWFDRLCVAFGGSIGVLGGGAHDIRDLTVTTYDSAFRHIERLGDRFGLLIFDEVHHLPGPAYLQAAQCAIAPFRLGLTATLERADGREADLRDLVGPVVYRREINELAGDVLSPYETVRVAVNLTPAEEQRYQEARRCYLDFLRDKRIRVGGPGGWNRFLSASCRSRAGRRALLAYRQQRDIALNCQAKLEVLAGLLRQHRQDRVLIFTDDTDSVYRIAQNHLVAAITHETEPHERQAYLQAFRDASIRALVTSRVLNEGVDVPAANVAVVLSGNASIREHVQRLGRILRREPGKEAVLYEVITAGTTEQDMSRRRRDHSAYGRSEGDADV